MVSDSAPSPQGLDIEAAKSAGEATADDMAAEALREKLWAEYRKYKAGL